MQLIQRRNKSVTIFSNTKLREIFEFSVYPSKLKVQVFVLLFLVTLFISPSILSLLHALSLYKPLAIYTCMYGHYIPDIPKIPEAQVCYP